MTDPLYDSRNPNHGRAGGLRDPEPRLSAGTDDALSRIVALAPRHNPYTASFRCQQCGHRWGFDESEHHGPHCAYVIARDAMLRPAQPTPQPWARDTFLKVLRQYGGEPYSHIAINAAWEAALAAQPPAAPVETAPKPGNKNCKHPRICEHHGVCSFGCDPVSRISAGTAEAADLLRRMSELLNDCSPAEDVGAYDGHHQWIELATVREIRAAADALGRDAPPQTPSEREIALAIFTRRSGLHPKRAAEIFEEPPPRDVDVIEALLDAEAVLALSRPKCGGPDGTA